MEKFKPHYSLAKVCELIAAGKVRATATAFGGALELGIESLEGMCAVILGLTQGNFYKSMTTRCDHTIWQDVYHAQTKSGDQAYIKLTVIEDVLIVSFKEL
ncbi:type II toxin-antitoxin system MqsR family toxin [Aestuariivirga sp.]|uniref:type II toxin-antitoxin system MqsR family toxin n=1 Tax=Aestuariivirga sp. TaxID=2650926 RepID=UPI0039E5B5A8